MNIAADHPMGSLMSFFTWLKPSPSAHFCCETQPLPVSKRGMHPLPIPPLYTTGNGPCTLAPIQTPWPHLRSWCVLLVLHGRSWMNNNITWAGDVFICFCITLPSYSTVCWLSSVSQRLPVQPWYNCSQTFFSFFRNHRSWVVPRQTKGNSFSIIIAQAENLFSLYRSVI